jgi:hypothetical protein
MVMGGPVIAEGAMGAPDFGGEYFLLTKTF